MDSKTTETKTPLASRSKTSKSCENLNPNLSGPSPGLKKISNSQGEMEPLSRDRLLEDARNSGPLSGYGRVPRLVEAFERLLKDEYGSKDNYNQSCVKNQAFGGRDLLLTAENQVSSFACFSVKSDISTLVPIFSISSSTSRGGKRSPRNERGHLKEEEELMNKKQKLVGEEEKLWIPIAQGLPWTTNEPKCLIKPPLKENIKPIDLRLHSDIRAVERARFAHQVAEKRSLIKQYKMERERQQKLEEEEEIKRMRKELIPKAQLMPYFDRPFVPRRSVKQLTVPREPRFNIRSQRTGLAIQARSSPVPVEKHHQHRVFLSRKLEMEGTDLPGYKRC